MSSLLANSPAGVATPNPWFETSAARGTIVIATIAPVSGETGVQTHSRALLDGLVEAGQQCVLQSPLGNNWRWGPLFAVRPLLLSWMNKTWATRWLRHWHEIALRHALERALERRDVAAVIAQCPLSARAAMEVRGRGGRQFAVVTVCHFNYSEGTEYRDKGELIDEKYLEDLLAMEKQVLESVDRVIFVSQWAKRVVEDERGIRPRESSVIWNGIPAQTPPARLTRSDWGLGADDLVLANVGTLEPRKNQLALVRLFAKIVPSHPHARLLLVGDGPSRTQIESCVAELKLQSKVRLVGFRKDVPDILSLADMYIHTALLENCPMVLLEAARAGLPIAAVPAGGVPELLAVLHGIPLDINDPSALLGLLADKQLRIRAGRLTREAFTKHFTCQAMVDQYVRVLKGNSDAGGHVPP